MSTLGNNLAWQLSQGTEIFTHINALHKSLFNQGIVLSRAKASTSSAITSCNSCLTIFADMVEQATSYNTSLSKPRPQSTHSEMNTPKVQQATETKSMSKERNTQGRQQTAQEKLDSYYADKDLAWWIELARDFKRATKVPLPEETETGL